MRKCRLPALAVLWLGTTATVFATSADQQEKPVIVTATRTVQTADAALASATVITRKDIAGFSPGASAILCRGEGLAG